MSQKMRSSFDASAYYPDLMNSSQLFLLNPPSLDLSSALDNSFLTLNASSTDSLQQIVSPPGSLIDNNSYYNLQSTLPQSFNSSNSGATNVLLPISTELQQLTTPESALSYFIVPNNNDVLFTDNSYIPLNTQQHQQQQLLDFNSQLNFNSVPNLVTNPVGYPLIPQNQNNGPINLSFIHQHQQQPQQFQQNQLGLVHGSPTLNFRNSSSNSNMLSSPTDALTQQQQTQAQIISLMNATDNIMPQMSPVQMINSQQQKRQIFTTPVNTPSISYGDYLSGNGGGVSVLQSTAPTFTDASLNAPLSSSVTNASTSASTNKRLSLSAKSPHIPLGNTNSPKTNPTSDSLSRSKSHSRKSISIMKSPHIPLGGSLYSVDSLPSASPSYPAHQLQSPLAGLGDSFQGMYMQSPTLSLHSSNYDSPDLPFNETESSGGSKKKREFRCTVEGCDKTFTRRYNLKSHHLSIHTRERPYACPECTQSFARQHDLKRHVKSVHTDNRPHACPHCTLTFSRSDALKRHLAVETKKMQMEGLPIGSPVTKILNGSGVTPGTSPYVPPGSGKMYMVGPSPAFSMGDEEIDDREDHMEALDAALDADPEETMKQIMMAVGGSGAINNQNNGGMQQQILNDFNFAVPYPKN